MYSPVGTIGLLACSLQAWPRCRRAVDEGQLFGLHRDTPNPACLVGRHIQGVLVDIVDDAQRAMEASLSSRTLADVTLGVVRAERQQERKRRRG